MYQRDSEVLYSSEIRYSLGLQVCMLLQMGHFKLIEPSTSSTMPSTSLPLDASTEKIIYYLHILNFLAPFLVKFLHLQDKKVAILKKSFLPCPIFLQT